VLVIDVSDLLDVFRPQRVLVLAFFVFAVGINEQGNCSTPLRESLDLYTLRA
jgi:uncharacterized protein involved in exopolysaccharide biosynthesis